MNLSNLHPAKGSRKNKRRVGRGPGSGRGKTAGRGTKGQKSISGYSRKIGFEGGQMPLNRRLPKRGFTNIFKKKIAIVNIRGLSKFKDGDIVDEAALRKTGLIKGRIDGVKLLANGDISDSLTVRLGGVSAGARQKIEAAGGKVEA